MHKLILKIITKIPTRHVTSGLILIILLFIYGIVGSYLIMGLNFLDSLYYAVITMSTVGYGDYTPYTAIQKIFTTTLALSGVALLAYVFNVLLTNFQEKMNLYSKGVKKMQSIDEMDDYYILCGFGRVGKVVFDELTRRHQNVIVIDKNEKAIQNIEESKNVVVFNRDATEDDFIAKLANEKCNSVILATGDDVNSLFIVLTIRENNPDVWIVTRSSKIKNISRLKKAGANKIVSPEIIGGKNLYLESANPHTLRITVKHDVDCILEEFKIIMKHNCTLENVDYHFPGIETPLTREIKTSNLKDGQEYIQFLDAHQDQKLAISNLYDTCKNIHSHLISASDKTMFDKLLEDLQDMEEIVGVNLSDSEIAKLTMETIKD